MKMSYTLERRGEQWIVKGKGAGHGGSGGMGGAMGGGPMGSPTGTGPGASGAEKGGEMPAGHPPAPPEYVLIGEEPGQEGCASAGSESLFSKTVLM